MEDLLPHFERELAFLRSHAASFSQAYPKVAGRLMGSPEGGDDPHVARMIESFALIAARVHKRLDDDFPRITESFFEVLYPHYLRPFPACAIAQFELGSLAQQMNQPTRVPRGAAMSSRAIKEVACGFRSAYEVKLVPLEIAAAGFRAAAPLTEGATLPAGVSSVFTVELHLLSPDLTWASLGPRLRVHLTGDASQVSALREVLSTQVLATGVQESAGGRWQLLKDATPLPVGFADDESLIDFDARSNPAYRLLTEYFAFPEKFNFLDLPLDLPEGFSGTTCLLHFLLGGMRSDSDETRLLETVDQSNLQLGCTPVVNLFKQNADPIQLTHASASYPLLPDGRRPFGYEVYSVDSVRRVSQSAQDEEVDSFRPFYSLRHDDLGDGDDQGGRYWHSHRNENVAAISPGFEHELSIVDAAFNPAAPVTQTLSVMVTASNRDVPRSLSIGNPGGDLFMEGSAPAKEIRLLRKPTATMRFEQGQGALWRLVSHLSVNHLSLSGGGIDALREMLRLYDLPRSAVTRRQIDSLSAIDFKPATAWLAGQPFASFVRGTEIRLSLNDTHFVGSGLRLFAMVLDHFFALSAHANSFTQLKVVSSRTQQELFACPRRSGDSPLL
ncbi:MAG: hypothetical protein RLZZ618_571 [Pseudomonadota bacterium]|jgi:type VI secretion system protein ImpG